MAHSMCSIKGAIVIVAVTFTACRGKFKRRRPRERRHSSVGVMVKLGWKLGSLGSKFLQCGELFSGSCV